MKERKAPQSKIPVQRAAIPVEDPAPESGLSREQVTLRQKGGWSNVAVESPTKTEKEIVKENVFTFFNLIFLPDSRHFIIPNRTNRLIDKPSGCHIVRFSGTYHSTIGIYNILTITKQMVDSVFII